MTVIEQLQNHFGVKIGPVTRHNDRRIYCEVAKNDLVEIALYLYRDLNIRFSIISGTAIFINSEGCMVAMPIFSQRRAPWLISPNIATQTNNINPNI